jgi:flagella basal body P-ring formation protein FlgA
MKESTPAVKPIVIKRAVVLVVVVFSFLPLSPTGSYAQGSATVRILENAKVSDDSILLGHVSEIKGDDPVFNSRLKAIVIGSSPLPGKSREIQKRHIQLRLKQSRIDISKIDLQFPPRSLVSRESIEITKEEIESIVRNFISGIKDRSIERARVKSIRVDDGVVLPGGNVTYKVVPPKNKRPAGNLPVSIHFHVDGDFYKRVWATVRMELLTEAMVTRKPLRRYQTITEDDILRKTMDLAKLPSTYLSAFEDVLGKRTRRKINAGVVLRSDLVELPPLVERGDVVSILAESEGLRVSAMGIAKESGCRGGRIRVVNMDSKKGVYARVVDSNTVKVEF